MRSKHNSSAQEQKKTRVFQAIQHSAKNIRYLLTYQTATDVYVKAYQNVRMEDKNDSVNG